MQLCCARGPACRASWAPSRHAPARAGTARRSRASTRTRARDSTGAHAHARICAHIRTRPSPPARAPTRAARLSGCTRRAVVGGRGVCWRAVVAAQAAGGQGGAAQHATRNGEVCGGALGRGCRRLLRSLGRAGRSASDGRAHHGNGAHRCAPDAHAARMGGEATRKGVDGARSALPLNRHRSPALEVSAGGVGGLDDPDASCRLQTALLSPCTGRIPSLRRIRGR